LGTKVDLLQIDAQDLDFASDTFDAALATFVFCSVPDPVVGLTEMRRVTKPGGQILLLEHVRIDAPVVGPAMDAFDPLVVQVMGAHINRRTVENVRRAGLAIDRVEELAPGGLVKLIISRVV
jgi:ubiquinone/menaquinone biosynthesis C-methylase UbiE